jgi:PadR family transcriptional regulator PadR
VAKTSFDPNLLKGSIQTIILALLADTPLHGYALAKEIERRSEDALTFGEGTIYPALKALERQGFISSAWENPDVGPARKVYSLTSEGTKELLRRRDTWSRFTRAIELTVGGETHGQPA